MSTAPANHTQERFLTTGQAAIYCGVNFRTVIRWIKKGYLEAARLPGRGDHRIRISDLIAFMNKNEIPIPSDLYTPHIAPPVTATANLSDTILIVEDDLNFAKSLQRILKIEGFPTEIAHGGFEAGTKLMQLKPKLITLDINMTGLDGIEVLRFIKSSSQLENTKVLVISGDTNGRTEEAIKLGANHSLQKPFERENLISAIKHLIAN